MVIPNTGFNTKNKFPYSELPFLTELRVILLFHSFDKNAISVFGITSLTEPL